jgi:hypothetical protein
VNAASRPAQCHFSRSTPGATKVYTMFAGSYPDRIGNPDDPDDVMVTETGIAISDTRWHRTRDAVKKNSRTI